MVITMGADPEAFLSNNRDIIVSAEKYYTPMGQKNSWGTIVSDGMCLELQVKPYSCLGRFMTNFRNILLKAYKDALERNQQIIIASTVSVTQSSIEEGGPNTQNFGCSPDLSIWGDEYKSYVGDASQHLYRYAGYHIHIGGEGLTKQYLYENCRNIIMAHDCLVGVSMVLFENQADIMRRKMYGKPGTYRIQPHGIEYRVLSGSIMRSPALVSLAHTLSRLAIHESMFNIVADIDVCDVINCIINSDKAEAKEIIKYIANKSTGYTKQILLSVLSVPGDIITNAWEKNWYMFAAEPNLPPQKWEDIVRECE